MNWQHTTWARWLGWTLVFALLFAGFLTPLVHPVSDTVNTLIPVCFVLCPIAAFAIGLRFPSLSWTMGPATAVLATVGVLLILPETGPATPTAMGEMTGKDQFELILAVGAWSLPIGIAFVYALLAWVGVKRGRRRENPVAQRDGDAAGGPPG